MLPAFFSDQLVTISHDVTVSKNTHIKISPRSGLQKAENIEAMLKEGVRGRVDDYDNQTVTITFFPGSANWITIIVDKVHFGTRFIATKEIHNER